MTCTQSMQCTSFCMIYYVWMPGLLIKLHFKIYPKFLYTSYLQLEMKLSSLKSTVLTKITCVQCIAISNIITCLTTTDNSVLTVMVKGQLKHSLYQKTPPHNQKNHQHKVSNFNKHSSNDTLILKYSDISKAKYG